MIAQFQYFGFQPEENLKQNAQLSLDRLVDQAPYGAMPVALMEKRPEGFRCAIEIYTQMGPFVAQASQESAENALQHACQAIQEKLARWRSRRAQRRSSPPPEENAFILVK